MNLENAERIIHRWIVTRRPGQKVPPLVRHAYTWTERKAQAKGPTVAPESYDLALLARDEIMQRGLAYSKRAQIRQALAEYLEKQVFPESYDREFLKVSERLRKARKTGTWGTRPGGELVTIWDDKSELVRLDPDEAREDAMRLAERQIPRLLELVKAGAGIHYAVFTMPNYAAGQLAKGLREVPRRYANMLRRRHDKKKLFPEILASTEVIEAPLAADGTWNIHLNVILVTRTKFEAGLYKKLRQAWHWHVHLQPVKTDVGDLARTFRELIKYPTRAVSEKSAAKAGSSQAPAMTDWPTERFVEWHYAHKGYRRTRSHGELYNVPKPAPLSLDNVTWHGAISCAPDRFFAQLPLINLIPGYRFATEPIDQRITGPP